ncbi:class I SAM-dependent methyltransferase [Thalassotalea euphylliae]|uniref:Class I SAM-dependent methyltransferase n=1 Tax=Thalassotalea euphylliae TaxID=1655234 RepID=A0A3E0TSF8_9GAMM|nr:class I SAM-dependent methyltransferase [Thalassotalea euphylliae]REL27576.1 class I SAM-dependent methyltransferase [Thalassotalea euphylliae]
MSNEQEAWHQYWQQGNQQSCVASSSEQALVEQLWLDWQASLPSQAKVLDLATGNGAVISSLLKASYSVDNQYIGVDYTSADNTPVSNKTNVSFVGGVDLAKLPQDTQSMDAVTSQFGFEYAAIDKTISQVVRVLKNTGQLQFIVHHSEGEIVRANRLRYREIEFLLAPEAPLEKAKHLVDQKISIDELEAAGQAYLRLHQGNLTASISGQVFETINQVVLAVNSGRYQQAKALNGSLLGKLSAEYTRLNQLIKVAKDERQIIEIVDKFKALGVSCRYQSILTNDSLTFAWLIDGVKNDKP